MKLDFTKLAAPVDAVVPIFVRSFLYKRKSYRVSSDEGWYKVRIEGNKVTVLEPYLWEKVPSPLAAMGYTHNNHIVFHNADVVKRKWGLPISRPLRFNQAETFSSCVAIVWEDKEVYYVGPNYKDIQIYDVKQVYDDDKDLALKGVTPELRTVFLFHVLERERTRELVAAAKKEEEHRRMIADTPSRLRLYFSRAGAEVLEYSLSGSRIIVDWTYQGSGHRYNTVLDSTTLMVLEAGFCMRGDDRRHNITSVVKTAEEFEESQYINITRR